MQDLCNLANTGSNIALYVAAAFGILALASLLLYQLKTGKTFSKGFFALLLVFGIVGTLLLAPAATHAGGAADCPQGSQTSNSGGNQASITCPTNWVVVPGNSAYNTTDFCVMKYTARNVGGTVSDTVDITDDDDNVMFTTNVYSGGAATSQANGLPWINISQTDAITAAQTAAPGAHLLTENEWMTLAHNVLANPANWCNPDGSGCGNAPGTSGKVLASGHNDDGDAFSGDFGVNGPLDASTDDSQACYGTVTPGVNTPCGSEPGTQKRTLTLSNGSVLWDLVGNVGHWTSATETRGNLPSIGGSGSPFEYNTDTGLGLPSPDNWGTLTYINPAIQNPAAANWGIAQGLGILVSAFDSGSSTPVAFFRGGAWCNGPPAGAFALDLEFAPSDSSPFVGFRSAL
jgi:hypothetical protein